MTAFGFNENDAKRIGKVVRLVERSPDKPSLGGPDYGGRSPGVRLLIAKHESTTGWDKETTAVVTVYNGDPIGSAVTVVARNQFLTFSENGPNEDRWVALSNNGFGWCAISQSEPSIRIGVFEGSWSIDSTNVVTFNADNSTHSLVAVNHLFTIGDACSAQTCYVGKLTSPNSAEANWHLLNVQHHETAVVVSVTLTTAALEFTRRLVWTPYPGATSTISIALSTDTACST